MITCTCAHLKILKHTTFSQSPSQGVEFVTECSGCNKAKRTSACGPCQRPVLFCALCCIPVKGAANACLSCGHGGHLIHMMQWFEVSKFLKCTFLLTMSIRVNTLSIYLNYLSKTTLSFHNNIMMMYSLESTCVINFNGFFNIAALWR